MMNLEKKVGTRSATALAFVLAAGLAAGSAQAVTVSLLDSSSNGSTNNADQFAASYGAYVPAGATWSGTGADTDPLMVTPPSNATGIYLSPFANTLLGDGVGNDRDYFSTGGVDGAGNGSHSPVTLTFAGPIDSINMLWGSIDSYNELTLYSGTTVLDSFTGTEIVTGFGLPAEGSTNTNQVALLNFTDFGLGGLTSMKFASSTAALEFAFAPVPLPASLLLLIGGIGGLAGLGFTSRRHKGVAA